MKSFLDENFLLENTTAQELYHEQAKALPIIDYHCHLDPRMVAEDHRFRSITELWLGGDHYKWRAERTNGVPERLITGDASDWDKFEAWAKTMPYCMRNPLYHWTHLELKTAFGITKLLNPQTAREIFHEANERLQNDPNMTARGLMRHYGVELVCTTDDPVDDLRWHKQVKDEGFEIRMLPAWRPDKAMAVENPYAFRDYVAKLAKAADMEIRSFQDFTDALERRHEYFHAMGSRLSDHGINEFYDEQYNEAEIRTIFNDALAGKQPTEADVRKFKCHMLYFFAVQDYEAGWTQQFHYGAMRNNNSRMMQALGPDTGYDSIGQSQTALAMSHFFNRLNENSQLTKTIIYNLNPADNEMVATMLGNFQDGSVPGKIQWGSGWWFLDQKDGIERQLNALSALGLLSRFVGMLTDSRSFLSYPRHEYFRRILCNLVGRDIERGELPYEGYEQVRVKQMIKDISYYNAKQYFKF